jgi:succinate dehydrogenase / fumarate reductase cytochrome b subunit
MNNNLPDNRPVYLNLIKIRLPVTGIISIAHRITGLILFLFIPYSVYLLGLSTTSEADYNKVLQILNQPWMGVLQVVLFWSLAHHLFAGIRYLLIDAEIGVDLKPARVGAWLVIAAESIVLVLIIVWVMGRVSTG